MIDPTGELFKMAEGNPELTKALKLIKSGAAAAMAFSDEELKELKPLLDKKDRPAVVGFLYRRKASLKKQGIDYIDLMKQLFDLYELIEK